MKLLTKAGLGRPSFIVSSGIVQICQCQCAYEHSNALAKLTKFLDEALETLQRLIERFAEGFRGSRLAIQASYMHQSPRLPSVKDQIAVASVRRISYQIKMDNCDAHILLAPASLMFD